MPDGNIPFVEADPNDGARIARQLAMLDAVAAAGVQAVREVGRQAEAGQTPAAEISLAYARVSRAVRLAIMLQSQLVEASETREARLSKAVEEAEDLQAHIRKSRVGGIVERVARQAHPGDGPEADSLVREADERLDDMDLYGDLLERPMSEIVARLCHDLNLTPDWTQLAQELWAQEEIAGGMAGAPLQPPPPEAVGGGPAAVERLVEGASGARHASASAIRDSS